MATRIRLARGGRKKRPFYRIVVTDSRAPRDSGYIEAIGTYNPLTDPSTIEVDVEKAKDWLSKGAQPSGPVARLLEIAGVLEKKSGRASKEG